MNTARYIGSRSESNLRGAQFASDRTTLPMMSITAATSSSTIAALIAALAFLQRADSVRSCQVSEIQLTGGSLLQLDQRRDQLASLALVSRPSARSPSRGPPVPAGMLQQPPARRWVVRWMEVSGRAEAGMGGSRVSRHVSPDMHQDNYKIRPVFYGELIRPAQFSPWLGKNLAARLRAWATLKSRSGV